VSTNVGYQIDSSPSPQWKGLYKIALLEMDPLRIPDRIADARKASLDCVQQIAGLRASRSAKL
jgi:hypothetical protein